MSENRFFVPPDIFNGAEIFFPRDISRQISSVLRLKAGERVIILDNSGHCRIVELHEVDSKSVSGQPGEILKAGGEPNVELILCPALTGRDKFEWILQKGTEMGVHRFLPLVTARTLIQEIGGLESKMLRWQKIVQEAAEQCGRGLIPQIDKPVKLTDLLKRSGMPRGYILYEKEQGTSLAKTLSGQFADGQKTVMLLIGPEGGFSETEAELASSAGYTPVSLGQRILRMETAALAACVICMSMAGEMG